ncbi:MAG TPA: hypothetical protein VEF34_07010 [Syntrophobacteraceae bacterium]|nr:hypothetical protein [Syntrophobacteraceae bacterium]
MCETFIEFAGGGIVLVLVFWGKLAGLIDLLCPREWKQVRRRLQTASHLAVGFLAAACLLDPLIPGTAIITVQAPKTFPTLQENLRVQIVPIGFCSPAGASRAGSADFDSRGVAEVRLRMRMFETRALVEIFDKSRPSQLVATKSVYISPFVRRQLTTKKILF